MGQMMYFGGGTRLDDNYEKSGLSEDEFIQQVCILHNIPISLKFLFSKNIHTAKSKNAN